MPARSALCMPPDQTSTTLQRTDTSVALRNSAVSQAAAEQPPSALARSVSTKAPLAQAAVSSKTLIVEAQPIASPVAAKAPPLTITGKAEAGQKIVTLARPPIEAFVLRSDSAARSVDLSVAAVKLEPKEMLLSKTTNAPRKLADGQARSAGAPAVALPYEMHFLDEGGQQRNCELVVEIGSGFRVSSTGRLFVAQLFVALKDKADWSSVYALPQALSVLVSAAVDDIAPRLVSLQKTNSWQGVALADDAPEEQILVKIRPTLDPGGLELTLPVTRPQLSLTLNPSEIQGFGLDATKVVVRAIGLPNPADRIITLEAKPVGRLTQRLLKLDAEGTAETELRSEGIGAVRISAEGAGAAVALKEGYFRPPFKFAISAVLGAWVGAFVAFLRSRRSESTTFARSLKEVAAGVLLGILVAVAYAAGVKVLSIDLPTLGGEALVFIAAALGALGLSLKLSPPSQPLAVTPAED